MNSISPQAHNPTNNFLNTSLQENNSQNTMKDGLQEVGGHT